MGAVVVLIVCWQIKGGEAGEGKALKTELIWLVQFSRHARERAQNTMKPHPNEQPQILGAGQESGRSPGRLPRGFENNQAIEMWKYAIY